jgi:hypothetical protein
MHFGYSTKQNRNRQFKMTEGVDKGDVWMEGGVCVVDGILNAAATKFKETLRNVCASHTNATKKTRPTNQPTSL